jgi:hypothetical protein
LGHAIFGRQILGHSVMFLDRRQPLLGRFFQVRVLSVRYLFLKRRDGRLVALDAYLLYIGLIELLAFQRP